MHNTDEAVNAAADDIARNGPFPRRQAAALRADHALYFELGEVARRRVEQHRQGGEHYWTFWTRRSVRQHLIRGAIVVGVLTAISLLVFASFARSEECPAGAKSCKVLVLTPEEEQAFMQPRGVLDTARQGRPLELGEIVSYFREKISKAPAGTVPPEAVPVPRPRPSEAPKNDAPSAEKP